MLGGGRALGGGIGGALRGGLGIGGGIIAVERQGCKLLLKDIAIVDMDSILMVLLVEVVVGVEVSE